jgi:hypothetical protein
MLPPDRNDPSSLSSQATLEPSILTLSRDIAVCTFRASDAGSLAHSGNYWEMWLNGPDVIPYPYELYHAQNYIKRALDAGSWLQTGPSWAGPAVPGMYAIAIKDVAIGSIGVQSGTDIKESQCESGFLDRQGALGKGNCNGGSGGVLLHGFGSRSRSSRG